MSYNKIVEAIHKIDEAKSWESLLFTYNHKKAPNEYTCYSFTFANNSLRTNLVNEMCKSFLAHVDDFDKKVENYTGLNSKNVVDKLETDDDLIKDCWSSLIKHISISDDATQLDKITANAFIFVGTYKAGLSNKNIYLLSRKNPIVNLKKGHRKAFVARENTVMEITEPLVQFGKCFDALVYEGVIYMINSNCESIFNLEQSRKKICKSHLDTIEKENIIADMDAYEIYALSGQTPCKFITFSDPIFKKVCSASGKRILQNKFKIPIDPISGQYDLSDPQNAKNFTSIICGKTKKNLFDEDFCEVPTSIPVVIP